MIRIFRFGSGLLLSRSSVKPRKECLPAKSKGPLESATRPLGTSATAFAPLWLSRTPNPSLGSLRLTRPIWRSPRKHARLRALRFMPARNLRSCPWLSAAVTFAHCRLIFPFRKSIVSRRPRKKSKPRMGYHRTCVGFEGSRGAGSFYHHRHLGGSFMGLVSGHASRNAR